MPAIGIALVWAAYSAGLWGYMLIRGYNVTAKQLFSTTWPPPMPGKQPGPDAKTNPYNAFGQGAAGGGGLIQQPGGLQVPANPWPRPSGGGRYVPR